MSSLDTLKKDLENGVLLPTTSIISNKLARQNSKLTLEEEKLMHCIFSKLNAHGKNENIVKIEKAELWNLLGLTSTNRYAETKKKLQGLIDKTMVDFVDEKRTNYVGVVVTGFKSDYKSDHIEVSLNPLFMPFIEQLTTHYTKLEINSIVQFDSQYSLDLYKYLKSWNKSKEWEFGNARYLSTKQLKELFGLDKEDYVSNGKFQRTRFEQRTIDTAIKEINSKTEMVVQYTKAKKGNRIIAYVFEIFEFDKWKKSIK